MSSIKHSGDSATSTSKKTKTVDTECQSPLIPADIAAQKDESKKCFQFESTAPMHQLIVIGEEADETCVYVKKERFTRRR